MRRCGLCSPRARNLVPTLMTALRRHHAAFARKEVDYLHADRALARLNDEKVALGQGHDARAVLQVWF